VQCWGDNSAGELGDGSSTGDSGPQSSTTPVPVSGLSGVTAISAQGIGGVGPGFACAVLSSGSVECWGDNSEGELGDGTSTGPQTCPDGYACSTTPVAVSGLSGATAISAGGYFACALLSGTMQCWGYNGDGQFGNGTTTSSSTPVVASSLSGVTAISAGASSACALLSGGTVQCWGNNENGELGNGTTTSSDTPVSVSGLSAVTAISASQYVACALLSGGTVQCWGWNTDYGGLGNGTTTSSSTPVAVSGLSGVTAISVGESSACALLSGGTVKCWGYNGSGQLGDGTTTGPETCSLSVGIVETFPCATTPVAVSGLSGVTAISVGNGFACALLSSSTVECWGDNGSGQLGNGTTTSSSTPVPVTLTW
jgi:hypothetical protein